MRFDYVRRVNRSDTAPRVLLADDHHFFREGLRDMLESAGMQVVGEARDGAEAVALAGKLEPDLIVIDLGMSDTLGAEALRRIAATNPKARAVVLTTSANDVEVLEALEAGACGYILKDTQPDEMIDSIRRASGDQVLLSRDVALALVKRATPNNYDVTPTRLADERPPLTARELDVLRLIVQGADNAAIGLELSISRHTVKQHVTNIFEKLGVRTRVEAAVYAVRSGLVA